MSKQTTNNKQQTTNNKQQTTNNKQQTNSNFMSVAIKEAEKGIAQGHGGPFGAVIVKDNIIIGKGHNKVLFRNNPIWHGEMVAIESACKKLKAFDLSGCDVYTTGEPCPMCLAALKWANVKHIYYGCTLKDNENIGFRDLIFNEKMQIDRKKYADMMSQVDHDKCLELFEKYKQINNKKMY